MSIFFGCVTLGTNCTEIEKVVVKAYKSVYNYDSKMIDLI